MFVPFFYESLKPVTLVATSGTQSLWRQSNYSLKRASGGLVESNHSFFVIPSAEQLIAFLECLQIHSVLTLSLSLLIITLTKYQTVQ